MDLKSLNTLIQVAELGSFTKAGERLGYSQPTVSFQIKQLEAELGIQLFDRIGHTVTLTEDGHAALAYAHHICHLMQEMAQGTNGQLRPNGRVHLGLPDSLCQPLIVGEFKKLRQQYPGICLRLTTAGTSELLRLLDHNEVDLICTLDEPVRDTAYIIAHEETVYAHFVCAAGSPLARQTDLSLPMLLEQPVIVTEKGLSYRRLLDERLAESGRELHPALEMNNADRICQLVAEGQGISFLPDYITEKAAAQHRIVRLSVEGYTMKLQKQLIYHRDKWLTPAIKALIRYLSGIRLG